MRLGVWFVLCSVALAALGAGCSRKSPAEKAEALKDPGLLVAARGEASYVEPEVFHEGLGLRGEGFPGRLVISMRNRRPDEVAVVLRDLALINMHGQREVQILDETMVQRFVPVVLAAGEVNVTQVIFRDANFDPSGMRLVYNNPRQRIVFYVDVE